MRDVPVTSILADKVSNGEFETVLTKAFAESNGRDVYVNATGQQYRVGYTTSRTVREYGFEVPATMVRVDSNQTEPQHAAATIRDLRTLFAKPHFEAIARKDLSATRAPLWTLYIRVTE